ncbi:MAG: type 1 glutamine amidotransferase [Betaproteobacteria bacterium]|nr:type 1 glutamine amidotransferase [Betaproteobacteria bacterium]
MRTHILQHVSFEGPGCILPWLERRRATVSMTRFFESKALPLLCEFDLLVVLGGPMSVNDEADLPWLREEKTLIRDAVCAGKPVLGVCLGAQLIASALGASVHANAHKEIGWFPIRAVSHATSCFSFPEECTVFHWHGETFDLPPAAVHLATSRGCLNQAFQVGEHTIGLQFHLETTPESAAAILAHCRHELVPAPYVQTEPQLLCVDPARYVQINSLMDTVLTYLTRGQG